MPKNNTQQKTLKTPKLRFPGFEGVLASTDASQGGWEEKKLGEVAKFWNGKAHEKDISEDGKYIVVNSKFISSNGEVKKYSDEQISPLKKDDIAIVMSDIPNGKALAKCFYIDENDKYTLNQRIGGIQGKEVIPSFLYRVLNRNRYFLRFNNGVSQTNLRKSEVLNCPIISPSKPEQQKIAAFLGSVDAWIENLRAQRDAQVQYKKGMMQKIFSQEIRFKGEDGKDFPDWEEKKLGEVFKISAGKSKSQYIELEGKNIIVDMGGISSEGGLIAKKQTNYSEDFLTIDDLVMPKDDIGGGLIIGRVAVIPENGKYILGDHVYKLSITKGSIVYFSYLINSFEINKSFRQKANGTAQLGLNRKEVEKQVLSVPSLPEQQKIAEFLTSLDKSIELKEQQITAAETWKKGLMQGLFV